MILLLTYLLCVLLEHWYFQKSASPDEPPTKVPNVNPAIDEWNACDSVEEETESFYE